METAFGLDGDTRFLCCCGALFAIYVFMLFLMKGVRSISAQAVVFVSGGIFMISQLICPVMLSTDVFAYAFYGRLLSLYGSNAYATNLHVSRTVL